MNWYIGQRIVAVRSHSQGKFKKGDEFTIKGLRSSFCKCKEVEIDIGINGGGNGMLCPMCGMDTEDGNVHWFSEIMFAPLQDHPDLSETTYEDIMQEIEQLEPQTA